MKRIHVAAAVLNQIPLDWVGNFQRIKQAIEEARNENVTLLCLPELCVTGYGCEDAFHSLDVSQRAWEMLKEIQPLTKGMIVSVGLPVFYQNSLFNSVAMLVDGEIIGVTAKQHLAGDGIHYEPRWFRPWPAQEIVQLEKEGVQIPFGDIVFEVGGVRIGFEICEDAWVAKRPGSELSFLSTDIILNPSASHFAFDKHRTRERFVIEGSRAFGVTYIHANLLGNESGRVIYDGCALIAQAGKLLAMGPRLSFEDVMLTRAMIDVDQSRMSQMITISFQPKLTDIVHRYVKAPFQFPGLDKTQATPLRYQKPEETEISSLPWEQSEHIKEEEFTRAVSLALFDYMRKSHSRGFVVSLSGGADSAAIASLVYLMVELGTRELGQKRFLDKLHITDHQFVDAANPVKSITNKILTCIYQATDHSSETTRNAAEQVANAIGARHLECNIQTIVDDYLSTASDRLERELTWENDDLALQNIQARVRAPMAWLITNLTGSLLLATSNRSEAAVGYTTMDGDTAGGLCPIAGIDKAFLRDWLRWLEIEGLIEGIKVEALSYINAQAPTAELRPSEQTQTDESDLMPYPLLDHIERLAIRDKLSPLEIFEILVADYSEYSAQQIHQWLKKFFTLWSRNQWKRERFAPSFHLDDENLDPKTWCRFPILSAGFQTELAELEQRVKTNYQG
jgi:NAD+ synthase (glutamine-hydrolysing)